MGSWEDTNKKLQEEKAKVEAELAELDKQTTADAGTPNPVEPDANQVQQATAGEDKLPGQPQAEQAKEPETQARQPERTTDEKPEHVPYSDYQAKVNEAAGYAGNNKQLRAQVKDLEQKLNSISSELEAQRNAASKSNPSNAEPSATVDELERELVDAVGDEFSKPIRKIFSKLSGKLNELESRFAKEVPETVGRITKQSRDEYERTQFADKVRSEMPYIDSLHEGGDEAAFVQWLAHTPASDGWDGTFADRWDRAIDSKNIGNMKRIATEYASHCKRTGNPVPSGLSSIVQTQTQAPKKSLAASALPQGVGSKAQASTAEKAFSMKEIETAVDTVRMVSGRMRGYEDIGKAQLEKAKAVLEWVNAGGVPI